MSELEWTRDSDGVGGWRAENGGSSSAHGAVVHIRDDIGTVNYPNESNVPFDIVPFDIASTDTDGFFDASTHKLTIPTGLGGMYIMSAQIYFVNDAAITRSSFILETPDQFADFTLQKSVNGTNWYGSGCWIEELADGDEVYVDSGAWAGAGKPDTVVLFTGTGGATLGIARIGAVT